MLVAFTCAFGSLFADPNVWWVDDNNYGKAGLDGKSEATAYGTIQDALDNPDFAAGDTVKVLPGVYDKGETFVEGDGVTNRVRIAKACTIVSTGGKEVTAIVGKHSSATTYGCGPDAIRCICVDVTEGVRIEGFTIRDGASDKGTTENATHYGGGVYHTSGNRYALLVDCDIFNCTAWKGAAARNVTLVRCLVSGNHSEGGSGSVNNAVNFHSCVVIGNTSSGYALSTCGAVNTSIIGNSRGITGSGNYYNCLLCANESSERNNGTYYAFTCTASNGAYQVFAPALGDYRPVSGSGAIGTGDASYLTKLSSYVPADELYFDFIRNPFPETGACNIGAVQGVANPQGGALKAGGDLTVDGTPIKSGLWLFAETYPTQWNVQATAPEGQWLWGFSRGDVTANRFHPDLNGDAFVMPPPTGVCTATPFFASRAYWVNPNKDAQGADIGSDSNDGSEAAPFKTLQKAMDASGGSKYTMIFAAEGRYEEGGRCIDESQKNSMVLKSRICAVNNGYFVRIVGAGPGKSFVCGAPDPDTGGNGPEAVRPIGVYCNYTTVQGFTLTDGYSRDDKPDADRYGAAYGRSRGGLHVIDCEITNCHGVAGVANQATFTRCRFHGNETGGSLASGTALISCLFDGNRITGTEGGVLQNSIAANCTLQSGADSRSLSWNNNTIYASILDTCTKLYSADNLAGTLIWKVGTIACTGDWTVGNPYFVDPANGDWRVRSFSKAATCAGVPSADNYGASYWKYATSDYLGKPLAFRNGVPVAGCRQEIADEPGIQVEAAEGGVAGATDGWHSFAEGESATLTMGEGMRPCVGYTLGGVTNLFDETPSRTLTAADVPEGALVEAIYSNDWYVDANAADDTGLAFTPGSAKKTFAGLFGTGLVKSGDTVHAAEGTYDSGVMYREDLDSFKQPYTTGSRVVVPSDVTVVADGRIEETVIKGAPATIEPSATYGLGDDAVRCVTLNPNSKIRGFTLADGRTAMKTGREGWTAETPKNYYDNLGGAVSGTGQSSAGTQVAERCILKDCAARRGGGAAYVRLVNCRVTGMYASDSSGNGTSTYRSQHYGTVITGGKGTYAVMYPGSFIFSTVIDSYSNALYQPSSLIGSIVVGASALTSGSALKISNTLLTSMPKNATAEKNFTNGTAVVTAADLALDAEGRPTPRTSCALEQGDEALFDTYRTILGGGETDASGVPRIQNGQLDIGALEADWRKTYAQDIGVKKLAVESADPAVVESQDETVLVPEGSTLAGGLRNTTGRPYEFLLRFTVPTEGSLTLKVDGVCEVYAAGSHERRLTCEGDYLPLAFASTAGTAEILRGQSLMGALLLVR